MLHDAFGIESGFMTTIHAYTNDQQILDLPHTRPAARAAAAVNLIPTSTGAARAIGLVIPELKGKLDGISVRAPVADGSIVDFVAHLSRGDRRRGERALRRGRRHRPPAGILRYTDEPLVSSDIIGSPYSSIFDSALTMAARERGQGLLLVRQRVGVQLGWSISWILQRLL